MNDSEKAAALQRAEDALNRSSSLDALRAILPVLNAMHMTETPVDNSPPKSTGKADRTDKEVLMEKEAALGDDIEYLEGKAADAREKGDKPAADKATAQARLLKSAESVVENTTATTKREKK